MGDWCQGPVAFSHRGTWEIGDWVGFKINVEALKKRFFSLSPRIELQFLGCPAPTLITVPTEILQLSASLLRVEQIFVFD